MNATAAHGDRMRKDADWMRHPTDERILETIREIGNMTPRALSREGDVERLDISRDYAGDRCRQLAEYGLLNRIDRGLYGLTDAGRGYLDETLDASTLTPVDDTDS